MGLLGTALAGTGQVSLPEIDGCKATPSRQARPVRRDRVPDMQTAQVMCIFINMKYAHADLNYSISIVRLEGT